MATLGLPTIHGHKFRPSPGHLYGTFIQAGGLAPTAFKRFYLWLNAENHEPRETANRSDRAF